jgi:hypothetical protein
MLASLLAGCANQTIEGNGKLVDEVREVSDFSGIRIENGLFASVSSGEKSVVLSLDENLLEHVETFVEAGDLVLRTRDEVDIEASVGATISISTPAVARVHLSGGSELLGDLGAAETSLVSLAASGGSHFEGELMTNQLFATASGGSFIGLIGRAPELSVHASGGSEVRSELPSELVSVEASGGSDVTATASFAASIEASGGSEVVVHGAPATRNVSTSGGSEVHFPE